MDFLTEDKVPEKAAGILQIEVGQLTTFNELGFKGFLDKPDGWLLPEKTNEVAIIAEFKSSDKDISRSEFVGELLKNVKIAQTKYSKVVGILYNGNDVAIFKNLEKIDDAAELQNKEHYLSLFNINRIEVGKIFALTKRINDNLHFNFSLKNLNHRMIFTACALVAEQFGADLRGMKGKPYPIVKNAILHYLTYEIQNVKVQNKLHILIDTFNSIQLGIETNGDALNDFLDCVAEISENINSDFWNGEDVMAIFFHEFNRYKGKSEIGQVFTPDHITSFMYHLLDVNQNDIVLDAACGSGSFLVKAMCNMISEAGGVNTAKAKEIKQNQLFGIEIDREIFALACANMLIHKDGKTNLEQLDSRTSAASEWIRSKNPTKILMNPPFEQKYGCVKIVENVLESVSSGTKCAFIMPDKKLEKVKTAKKLLNRHRLEKIIKLPENTFDEGVTTSIFVFEAGVPQKNREIFACYFSDDGLETVKNGGRQDVRGAWKNFEKKWLEVVRKQVGDTVQWLNPAEHLSWQAPQKKFEICEEDFAKTVMDYLMFERKIEQKKFKEQVSQNALYSNFNVDFEARK